MQRFERAIAKMLLVAQEHLSNGPFESLHVKWDTSRADVRNHHLIFVQVLVAQEHLSNGPFESLHVRWEVVHGQVSVVRISEAVDVTPGSVITFWAVTCDRECHVHSCLGLGSELLKLHLYLRSRGWGCNGLLCSFRRPCVRWWGGFGRLAPEFRCECPYKNVDIASSRVFGFERRCQRACLHGVDKLVPVLHAGATKLDSKAN